MLFSHSVSSASMRRVWPEGRRRISLEEVTHHYRTAKSALTRGWAASLTAQVWEEMMRLCVIGLTKFEIRVVSGQVSAL